MNKQFETNIFENAKAWDIRSCSYCMNEVLSWTGENLTVFYRKTQSWWNFTVHSKDELYIFPVITSGNYFNAKLFYAFTI